MALILDWTDVGSPNADDIIVTDGTDTVEVDIDSDNAGVSNADDWIFNAGAGGHISARSSFTTLDRVSTFEFDQSVGNLNFEIFDVDAVGTVFQDQVRVEAFDADGNSVPIVFSDLEGYHVLDDANTVRATGATSGTYDTIGAADSITVDIAGPIVRLEVTFIRTAGTSRTGQVGIGNLAFDPICFVQGTRILSKRGDILVENLKVGDEVMTRDSGYKKIQWIGSQRFAPQTLNSKTNLVPVCIKKDAFGVGVPESDLRVSQQHRILIRDWRTRVLFDEEEMLAPAKGLLNDGSITLDLSMAEVVYFHILFDEHEVIFSNGLATESFHTGQNALSSIDQKSRDEVLSIFPSLRGNSDACGEPARAVLSVREAAVLRPL
jgi:hypothetical protein